METAWGEREDRHMTETDRARQEPQLTLPHVPVPAVLDRFAGSVDGFFTSSRDADALVEFACTRPDMRILEPAAGEGAIVHALMRLPQPPREIVAIETHEPFVRNLRASCEQYGGRVIIIHHDFFKTRAAPGRPFDMAILNPPYAKFQDVRFVEKCLSDALSIAALLLSSTLHNAKRARVWNSASVSRIDFLAKRPDPFENGSKKPHKPMREYIRIAAARSAMPATEHTPLVALK